MAVLTAKRSLRYLWAAPATIPGLLIVGTCCRRGRVRVVDGIVEAHSPLLAWALTHLIPIQGGALAITLGHVVLGRDRRTLDDTRTHEQVHVRQYEQWGPFFVLAYAAASLAAVTRGGHAYFDNRFEQRAWREA